MMRPVMRLVALLALLAAVLSSLAGALLQPGSGAAPLLWLMLLSACGSVAAMLLVIRRERSLGGLDAAR